MNRVRCIWPARMALDTKWIWLEKMLDFPAQHSVVNLSAALSLGAVIGLERGWQEREREDESRVAGLRTFALLGLFGGVLGALAEPFGPWPAAMAIGGVAFLAVSAYRENVHSNGSLSATTAVAMLLTVALGLLAGVGEPLLAIAVAVIAAVLLDLKPQLHRWMRHVEKRELSAALQMLVLTAVVLPILPDQGYGPYEALNPYRLWWTVVLIAGLSLCGHLAMRLTSPSRGIFWTGLLGGLASSTAATLAVARRVRHDPSILSAATSGILAASCMMFVRMTAMVALLRPALLASMGTAMVVAAMVLLATAVFGRRSPPSTASPAHAADPASPFDLSTALGFGVLLGVMAVLTRAAQDWLGDVGLYALALLSGLLDVDAILLTVMQMTAQGALPIDQATIAAGLAVCANMLMKTVLSWTIGGAALGWRVTAGFGFALSIAAGTAFLHAASS